MTSKLGGRPTKDSPISDNPNLSKLGVKKKDIAAAIRAQKRAEKIAKMRVKEVKAKTAEALDTVAQSALEEVERVRQQMGLPSTASLTPTPPPDPEPEDEVPQDDKEDEKHAYEMLQHLRYAYRRSRGPTGKSGKQRLVELMQDDREFKYMVKEMLKIESSLMAAKIRKGEDEAGNKLNQQNFFVVLKGLEDDKKFTVQTDKTVDLKQIENALNPTSDGSWQAEEVEDKTAAPVQLQKVDNSDNMEEW